MPRERAVKWHGEVPSQVANACRPLPPPSRLKMCRMVSPGIDMKGVARSLYCPAACNHLDEDFVSIAELVMTELHGR